MFTCLDVERRRHSDEGSIDKDHSEGPQPAFEPQVRPTEGASIAVASITYPRGDNSSVDVDGTKQLVQCMSLQNVQKQAV